MSMNRALLVSIIGLFSFFSTPMLASAQTPIVGGTIINQTRPSAGSPYSVQGDITIPAGAFLRIQPGVVVRFATSDSQVAGVDTSRIEVTVDGELTIAGSSASPVTLQSTSASPGSWYGVIAAPTAAD